MTSAASMRASCRPVAQSERARVVSFPVCRASKRRSFTLTPNACAVFMPKAAILRRRGSLDISRRVSRMYAAASSAVSRCVHEADAGVGLIFPFRFLLFRCIFLLLRNLCRAVGRRSRVGFRSRVLRRNIRPEGGRVSALILMLRGSSCSFR